MRGSGIHRARLEFIDPYSSPRSKKTFWNANLMWVIFLKREITKNKIFGEFELPWVSKPGVRAGESGEGYIGD